MSSRYQSEEKEARSDAKRMSVDWKKFHNPMIPKPKLTRKPVFEDYLLNQRVKRDEENEGEKQILRGVNWQSINANEVDDPDKYSF